jgi:hypothetical protein
MGWSVRGRPWLIMALLIGLRTSAIAQGPVDDRGSAAVVFDENRGQLDPGVRFSSRSRRYVILLTNDEAVLTHRIGVADGVRLRLAGAGATNTLVGRDPLASDTAVATSGAADPPLMPPRFRKINRRGAYPGIEVDYSASERGLAVGFAVAPRADPLLVRLTFPGVKRIDTIAGDDLRLEVGSDSYVLKKPMAYQELDGVRRQIVAEYQRVGPREVRFRIGKYDRTRLLVITPLIGE